MPRVRVFKHLVMVMCVLMSFAASALAQTNGVPDPVLERIKTDLQAYGDIDLYVFKDRQAFLAIMDDTLGLENIASPEKTFAKLPRSPFTITGRKSGKQIPSCQIFVPANIAPQSGNEIFAQLMRGWFGQSLTYQSNAEQTFEWLIHHEARHCMPEHYGDGDTKSHADEVDADIFAFNALSKTISPPDGLAHDIIAFRMITAALFADTSHMTALSVKYGLTAIDPQEMLTADQEIVAFRSVRKLVFARARALATGVNPTNRELTRAVTELREEVDQGVLKPPSPLVSEILMDLDDAISHLAPKLHQSVATRQTD
jgi:hypothetical protein